MQTLLIILSLAAVAAFQIQHFRRFPLETSLQPLPPPAVSQPPQIEWDSGEVSWFPVGVVNETEMGPQQQQQNQTCRCKPGANSCGN
jgi:hypothetical protein